MKKLYEIHDLTTNEILADNLNFDDMPELLGAYQEFYPNHEIIPCYRNYIQHNGYTTNTQKRKAFRMQWLELITENSCNIY